MENANVCDIFNVNKPAVNHFCDNTSHNYEIPKKKF